jgi:hypothetical protein
MDLFDITEEELNDAIFTLRRIKANIEQRVEEEESLDPYIHLTADMFNILTLDNVLSLLMNKLIGEDVAPGVELIDYRKHTTPAGNRVLLCKGCNKILPDPRDKKPLLAKVDGVYYPFCEKCHGDYIIEVDIDEE